VFPPTGWVLGRPGLIFAIPFVSGGSNMTDQHATYTAREVAEMLRCCETHIRRLARRDKIPGQVKGVGRLLRFARPAIDSWITCQRTG
jgi:excisionase family DNA binding protein